MKPFEEQFTAWVDGKLSGPELAAFEAELEKHPEALAERDGALKLGALLRQKPAAPKLTNADFFNLQIQQRIAADKVRERAGDTARGWFWSLPRLVFAGASALVVAGVLFKTMIPTGATVIENGDSPYFAQVIEAWTSEPGVSANTVYNAKDNVTVLWLDGLDYIPASYELK